MKVRTAQLSLVLIAAAGWVFLPLGGFGFFHMDDGIYVAENPAVTAGLTLEGARWAFTSVGYAANWHPLTWLSLMLDVQLFGVRPGAMHLVNTALHVLTAVLLMLVLKSMTGRRGASFAVAALFALHPLHVESVAWIAERKDPLAAVFWMGATGAYVHYLRRPHPARYGLALALFALGLLAKPMLVTLPFVFLLLDVWPLGRWRTSATGGRGGARRAGLLVAEKVPLLALAAGSAAMTMVAQSRGGLVAPLEGVPVGLRAANALLAYGGYLRKTFWPAHLAMFYPHPGRLLSPGRALAAGLLLVLLTAVAVLAVRRRPYLAVGWLWYLGTLVPVIGLVQVGTQSMADRYTYLPLVGIFTALVWAAADWGGGRPGRSLPLLLGAAVLLASLAAAARVQVGYWRSSEEAYRRAVEVDAGNWYIHEQWGNLLVGEKRFAEAVPHFREVLARKPYRSPTRHNLAVALAESGRPDEAIEEYRTVLRWNPRAAESLYNAANLLAMKGDLAQAAEAYREVILLTPGSDAAHNNLGTVLARTGDAAGAEGQYRESVRLNPDNAEAHNNLGVLLTRSGRPAEAEGHFREAIRRKPGNATAMKNLAAALTDLGRLAEADQWLREAAARPVHPLTLPAGR